VREYVRIPKLHAGHPAADIEYTVKEARARRAPGYDSVRLCLHHLRALPRSASTLDLSHQPALAATTWAGVQRADLRRYEVLLTLTLALEDQPFFRHAPNRSRSCVNKAGVA
jgi:hypothetical protein